MTEYIPTYPDLAGKVVVVTGGSGGIGAATWRTRHPVRAELMCAAVHNTPDT
jgi:NAD(P)-dependent dehydrogenase (short-subunit alcohol dehydrogenase family)